MMTTLSGLAMAAMIASPSGTLCTTPGPPGLTVESQVPPPRVNADLTLVQISALRDRNGRPSPHRALGFYSSHLQHEVRREPATLDAACPQSRSIRVLLRLSDRRIEVGSEVVARSCLYSATLAHYGLHAEADVAALNNLAERLRTQLQAREAAAGLDTAQSDAELAAAVETAVESEDAAYAKESRAAQMRIDGGAEVTRLERACSVRE